MENANKHKALHPLSRTCAPDFIDERPFINHLPVIPVRRFPPLLINCGNISPYDLIQKIEKNTANK